MIRRRQAVPTIAVIVAVVAVVLAYLVTGCGAPDRKAEADQLERAIKTMPGVQDAYVSYQNDFEHGASVDISVFMPDASPQRISDVVTRINTVRGDAFKVFDQTAEFSVTYSRQVRVRRGAELDPASVAADAQSVRRFSETVHAGAISINRGRSPDLASLDVDEVKMPADEVFAALRSSFGDSARVDVHMLAAQGVDMPLWDVSFPYSAEDQRRVNQQIAAMPVTVWSIGVGLHAAIVNLSVGLHSRDTAYQDLVSVIKATGAGPAHGLWLTWRLEGDSASQFPHFAGMVNVGGCTYPNSDGELHPQTYLTADARDLQQRVRKQFDACPKT